MSERRITQIMTETGCRDYIADIVEGGIKIRIIILLAQTYGNLMAERTSHRRDFKGVRQTIMDKYASRKRENLCLVLQSAKRRREDEPVIIALEVGTRMVAVVMKFFHPQTFVTYKSLPRHSG